MGAGLKLLIEVMVEFIPCEVIQTRSRPLR